MSKGRFEALLCPRGSWWGRSWGEAVSGCGTWSPCTPLSLPGQCPIPAPNHLWHHSHPQDFYEGLWVTPSRCRAALSFIVGSHPAKAQQQVLVSL